MIVRALLQLVLVLFMDLLSRLMVVSHEAKKDQSESPKIQRAANYCVSFTHVNIFII